jgi:hypothetical protein
MPFGDGSLSCMVRSLGPVLAMLLEARRGESISRPALVHEVMVWTGTS